MEHASLDTSVPADTSVPTDLLGQPISDEGNPAYLAGALHEAKLFYKQNRTYRDFFDNRVVLMGHRTVVDHRDAVPFVSGIFKEPKKFDVDDPAPPTEWALQCL